MEDVAKDLKQLGSGATKYPQTPEEAQLETFDNRWPEAPYVVELECPEFTSLCPKTGQPDFAQFKIIYVPDKKLVESKALKLYLFSFRNHGVPRECDEPRRLGSLQCDASSCYHGSGRLLPSRRDLDQSNGGLAGQTPSSVLPYDYGCLESCRRRTTVRLLRPFSTSTTSSGGRKGARTSHRARPTSSVHSVTTIRTTVVSSMMIWAIIVGDVMPLGRLTISWPGSLVRTLRS